jgi:hypothetical protein
MKYMEEGISLDISGRKDFLREQTRFEGSRFFAGGRVSKSIN